MGSLGASGHGVGGPWVGCLGMCGPWVGGLVVGILGMGGSVEVLSKEESLKCPTKVKISKKIMQFFSLKPL